MTGEAVTRGTCGVGTSEEERKWEMRTKRKQDWSNPIRRSSEESVGHSTI